MVIAGDVPPGLGLLFVGAENPGKLIIIFITDDEDGGDAVPCVVAYPPQSHGEDYLNCIQKATTVKPPDGRLTNMAANTLELYRMLKGGSENEEWGRADMMTGWTM